MTQTAPPLPTPPPHVRTTDDRMIAFANYLLYLAGFLTGVTPLVGLVLAYSNKDYVGDPWRSHYVFQIRTFWLGLLYSAVGFALTLTLVGAIAGVPILIAGTVWFIIRCATGISRLLKDEPVPKPRAWLV